MKSQVICDALNTVNPTPAQRARMRAALEKPSFPPKSPLAGARISRKHRLSAGGR